MHHKNQSNKNIVDISPRELTTIPKIREYLLFVKIFPKILVTIEWKLVNVHSKVYDRKNQRNNTFNLKIICLKLTLPELDFHCWQKQSAVQKGMWFTNISTQFVQ